VVVATLRDSKCVRYLRYPSLVRLVWMEHCKRGAATLRLTSTVAGLCRNRKHRFVELTLKSVL
jgi:predicted GIY-YIG superfamily endonuclease